MAFQRLAGAVQTLYAELFDQAVLAQAEAALTAAYSEIAFAELVLWQVPKPVGGSGHHYKYRLAYVVRGVCVLRYDNEAGKGDHRHYGGSESGYSFSTPEKLIADFQSDIARWNDENGDS